jgi:hypothetical protein
MIFKSNIVLAREDVEVHLCGPQTDTEHFCVCWRTVILKTASLLENDIWSIGRTWLPEVSKYSPAAFRPLRVVTGPAEYQDISQLHLHVSQLEPGIQDYRLPWPFGLMLGTT